MVRCVLCALALLESSGGQAPAAGTGRIANRDQSAATNYIDNAVTDMFICRQVYVNLLNAINRKEIVRHSFVIRGARARIIDASIDIGAF